MSSCEGALNLLICWIRLGENVSQAIERPGIYDLVSSCPSSLPDCHSVAQVCYFTGPRSPGRNAEARAMGSSPSHIIVRNVEPIRASIDLEDDRVAHCSLTHGIEIESTCIPFTDATPRNAC